MKIYYFTFQTKYLNYKFMPTSIIMKNIYYTILATVLIPCKNKNKNKKRCKNGNKLILWSKEVWLVGIQVSVAKLNYKTVSWNIYTTTFWYRKKAFGMDPAILLGIIHAVSMVIGDSVSITIIRYL